jgi:hypothetical protein
MNNCAPGAIPQNLAADFSWFVGRIYQEEKGRKSA